MATETPKPATDVDISFHYGIHKERTRTLQLIAELRAEWEQTREVSTYTQAAHNGYLAVTKALDQLRAKVEEGNGD